MRRRILQTTLLAVLLGAMLIGVANSSAAGSITARAASEIRPDALAPTTTRLPYSLTGYKWVGRTSVSVYSNWDGGTCVLDGTDFSGPPSTFASAAVATQLLQASIDDINTRLRGALVLVNAGLAPHADLCGKGTTEPIVIGWGTISQTGLTMSYGSSSASAPGVAFQLARVVLSDAYDFACPDAPTYRDLQHTMTHELLHAIGMDHSQDPMAIMAPVSVACQSPFLLQPDDIAGLASLYPPPAAVIAMPVLTTATTGSFDRVPASSGITPLVWNGGTVAQLAAATLNARGASVTIFVNGAAVVLIPSAPAFVNAAFSTAFPKGVPSGAIVLVLVS